MHPQYTAQIESIVMKLCPKRPIFQSETLLVYIMTNIAEFVSINSKLLGRQKMFRGDWEAPRCTEEGMRKEAERPTYHWDFRISCNSAYNLQPLILMYSSQEYTLVKDVFFTTVQTNWLWYAFTHAKSVVQVTYVDLYNHFPSRFHGLVLN
jgi:hypothetical protein